MGVTEATTRGPYKNRGIIERGENTKKEGRLHRTLVGGNSRWGSEEPPDAKKKKKRKIEKKREEGCGPISEKLLFHSCLLMSIQKNSTIEGGGTSRPSRGDPQIRFPPSHVFNLLRETTDFIFEGRKKGNSARTKFLREKTSGGRRRGLEGRNSFGLSPTLKGSYQRALKGIPGRAVEALKDR